MHARLAFDYECSFKASTEACFASWNDDEPDEAWHGLEAPASAVQPEERQQHVLVAGSLLT